VRAARMLLSDLAAHRNRPGEMMLMTEARDEKVPTSSIVMKAIDAKTFTELQAFVKDLESRPTERLLRDLPDLVKLSDAKAEIITYVIATKFRRAASEERQKIRDSVQATSDGLPHGQERSRVQDILERIRGLAV
jgi:predicted nuclease of restriction endonuclease-like RecB superfamily